MEKPFKKLVFIAFILFSIFLLESCDYSYQKQIGESYFIRCIENRYRMDIGFGNKELSESLIEQTVFEVYWNEKYILAKRHPEFKENKQLTEYYIIEKVIFGEERARDFMMGPVNKKVFDQKIKELNLNIEDMEHIVYNDLK